jgi:FkbM family methyltransferase
MIAFVRRLLRRLISNPRFYGLARQAMLLGQYALRRPDEPDLLAFASCGGRRGLAVDIGANGGQSAIALAFILRDHKIISFEPNPALWPELDFVRRIVGSRFSYRKLGLADRGGSMTLHVPQVGDLPITTRASLSRADAEAHCAALERETGRKAGIAQRTVDIVRFDDLGLVPDVVKIDVEGYELQVLEGMRSTLAASSPMIMLEANTRDSQCRTFLSGFGYRFAYFDRETRKLVEERPEGARNWFAVPQ